MKSLKERTEIQQAYLDGITLELSDNDGGWDTLVVDPSFDWIQYDYRIKPEPMEIYVLVFDTGRKVIVDDGYTAEENGTIYKFRQVME